jgi:class 3 adenylate cyclase
LENLTHPLINRAVRVIGGPAAVLSANLPLSITDGNENDALLIDVVAVTDASSLRLRVLVAIPLTDFTEKIYQARGSSIGGVVGATVGVIILSIIIAYISFLPLERLSLRMKLASTFDDTDPEEPVSALSDVSSMQLAYYELRRQLTRVQSYVPQTVLGNGDDEEEEEEGEVTVEETKQPEHRQSTVHSAVGGTPTSRTGERSERQRHDTRSYRSSSRSHRSQSGKNGVLGVVPRTLNVDLFLKPKNCSVVVVNVKGFHASAKTMSSDLLLESHALLTSIVRTAAQTNRGVVDTFYGDHFTVTFNASAAAAAHSSKAATFCNAVLAKAAGESVCPGRFDGISIGAASGMAMVGNLGDSQLKRFSIVGPVLTRAMELERMAKRASALVAIDVTVAKETVHSHYSYPLDRVQWASTTGARDDSEIVTIYGLGSEISHAMDEWLYQLEESANSNPFTQLRDLFETFFAPDSPMTIEVAREKIGVMKSDEKLIKNESLQAAAKNLLRLMDSVESSGAPASRYRLL